MLSPSPLVEGLEESPSPLDSLRRTVSSGSASSEMSLELSAASGTADGKAGASSTAKRLDFESPLKAAPSPEVLLGSPAGSTGSSMSEEAWTGNSFGAKELFKEPSRDVQTEEVDSHQISSEDGEVVDFSPQNGIVETSEPAVEDVGSEPKLDPQPATEDKFVTTEAGTDDLDKVSEETEIPILDDTNKASEETGFPILDDLNKASEEIEIPILDEGPVEPDEPVEPIGLPTEDLYGMQISQAEAEEESLFPSNAEEEMESVPISTLDDLSDGQDGHDIRTGSSSDEIEKPIVEDDVVEEVEVEKGNDELSDGFASERNEEPEIVEENEIFEVVDSPPEPQIPTAENGIKKKEDPLRPLEGFKFEGGKTFGETTKRPPVFGENSYNWKSPEKPFTGFHSVSRAENSRPAKMARSEIGRKTEGRDWRQEAENQSMQLTTQLSLLQKRVEEKVEFHEKTKVDDTSADTEGLSKQQLTTFADSVSGLRQNIDDMQEMLRKEGGDRSVAEHWVKDLHSKCADQSAQLEHLGKQVGLLAKDLEQRPQLRTDTDDQQAEQTQEVNNTTQLIKKNEEDDVGEVIDQLLADQLREAQILRETAELRVQALNRQIENLEMVYDISTNIQLVSRYQDKVFKHGVQALIQVFLLAVGVITLYRRVAEPLRGGLVPT